MTSTKCDNAYLESDGFCVKCGEFHTSVRKSATRTPRPASVKPQISHDEKIAQIWANIDAHPIYRVVHELSQMLIDVYELKNCRVIFRNRQQSCFETRPGQSNTLIFGYVSVDRAFKYGFSEYESCAYLIGFKNIKGIDGVKTLVAHEFAHALTRSRYGLSVKPHGVEFQQCYKEVLALVF